MSGGRAPCSAGFGSSRIRRGPRAPQRAALCVLRASGSPGWLRDGEPNQASLRPIVRLKLRRSALLSLPCSRTGRPSELTEAPTVEAPRLRSGQPPCSLCLACPAPANLSRAFSIEKFLALELQRAVLVISFSSRRRRHQWETRLGMALPPTTMSKAPLSIS